MYYPDKVYKDAKDAFAKLKAKGHCNPDCPNFKNRPCEGSCFSNILYACNADYEWKWDLEQRLYPN